jgi:hypothetical protein
MELVIRERRRRGGAPNPESVQPGMQGGGPAESRELGRRSRGRRKGHRGDAGVRYRREYRAAHGLSVTLGEQARASEAHAGRTGPE